MIIADEIDQIRAYCSRAGSPVRRDNAGVTSELIGIFYDQFLLHAGTDDGSVRFMNYGYWYRHTNEARRASENLMERLIAGAPNRSGKILDVACGSGASTRYLSRYWTPDHIVGINISPSQVSVCERVAPGSDCLVMDAASMTFEDNAFNNIICVEAAFHFNTRESFFRNTLRILKRGGMLALTDVLLHEEGHAILPMWLRCNFMPSLSAYGEMLYQIGFSQVSVVDISEEGWKSFARFHCATLHDDWIAGKCEFAELQRSLVTLYRLKAAIKHNLMCIAIK